MKVTSPSSLGVNNVKLSAILLCIGVLSIILCETCVCFGAIRSNMNCVPQPISCMLLGSTQCALENWNGQGNGSCSYCDGTSLLQGVCVAAEGLSCNANGTFVNCGNHFPGTCIGNNCIKGPYPTSNCGAVPSC